MIKNALETKLVTDKVIFHYPWAFEPHAYNKESTPLYSVILLLEKHQKELIDKINGKMQIAYKLAEEMYHIDKEDMKFMASPLRDGDDDCNADMMETGKYFIRATSHSKPDIVDANCKPIYDPSKVFDGVYGRANIYFKPYKMNDRIGLSCKLISLQVFKDRYNVIRAYSNPKEDFKN